MKVRIKKDCEKQLRMCDLKDGDMAVILAYNDDALSKEYAGTIVQRIDNNCIITIGKPSIHKWSEVQYNKLPVRKLESGEELIIE
jgi:hypothetical protein